LSDSTLPNSTTPTPDAAPKRRGGGTHTHKPECMCRPCKARRWQTQAFAVRPGSVDSPNPPSSSLVTKDPEAPLEVDFHVIAPPKGSSIKDKVLQYAAIRAVEPKVTNAEIAERLGVAPRTLSNYLSRAVKEGWLSFADPVSRVEHEIIPKTVENLIGFLDAKDRTVTIEVAKGTLFKQWADSKGITDGQNQTVLAIKIDTVLPDGVALPESKSVMVGRPKLPTPQVIDVFPES
jgi:hypothetical protein